MAWRSSLGALFRGNFREAVDYAFVPQSEVDRSADLDNRLQRLVADDLAAGTVTDAEANASFARLQENAFPYIFQQPGTSPSLGLLEGVQEGAENISSGVRRVTGDVFGFTLKTIPWQIWVVLLIVGFVYILPFIWPLIAPAIGASVKSAVKS